MFTKAQLIEKGRHYFNDKSVNIMLATSDGNFFYENCKSYADSHSKTRKIELFEIKREDLKAKEPKIEETSTEEEDVNEDALMDEYKEETGKNAVFRDKVTKGYLNWKNDR